MGALSRVLGMRGAWLLLAAMGIGGFAPADFASAREPTDKLVPERTSNASAVARPRQFPDGQAWTIEGGLAWGIGFSNAVVFVPHGFVHDRAGVPPALWSLASYTRAAIVHDWLYWAQPCSRLQADNLLMIAMKESGISWWRRQMVYRGVRMQGEAVWRRNAEERAKGLPRINPYGYVPDNLTWRQLRARMIREGVRDLPYVDPGLYCRFGDSQQVPGPPPGIDRAHGQRD